MAESAAIRFVGAATVFAVRDVARSIEHYRDVLGFRVEFTYGEPVSYAGVERGGVLLFLQAAADTARPPGQGAVYVFADDVDGLYAELTSRGARIVKAPRTYDYGMRDFDVHDPDGNQLCFGMESKRA
jgi:catechol 2,3-dioxygenase-like lactoylglutathione lyase family enzyme